MRSSGPELDLSEATWSSSTRERSHLSSIMSELIKFQLADDSKPMDESKGNAVTVLSHEQIRKKKDDDVVDSDDELLQDDADFVFMQEYRTKRLEEMSKNQPTATTTTKAEVPNHVSLLEHRKEFGICVETGGDGWFIQEIEEEDEQATIVVHIYEHAIRSCELVNKYMEELAGQWVHVKFLRLPASLCGVHVAANKLPIISIYRGGKLLSAIKNFKEELLSAGRDTFEREDFEWLLQSTDGWSEF